MSHAIPLRQLGRSGPAVPALGLGLMGLSFWDSADLYGDSEELLGKWFERTGKRTDIFLATKFGYIKGTKTFEVHSSAAYCKKACDESLKALGVDSIDLYYIHQVNPNVPIEETMRAVAELQALGKIKHIGLSNVSSSTLRRAVKIAPVAAVQTDYSVFVRDIEGPSGTNLLSACRELGVALVAAMPLSRGASGNIGSDMRAHALPRFGDENREKNAEIVARFEELAREKGCTAAQLAIAWLVKQGEDIFPIPGTKKVRFLEENCEAVGIGLTDEEEREVRGFVEGVEVQGGTVPDAMRGHLYSETVEEDV
ncbi:hypothetical protein OQA88_2140 [Cercophora sp. LCS_1]